MSLMATPVQVYLIHAKDVKPSPVKTDGCQLRADVIATQVVFADRTQILKQQVSNTCARVARFQAWKNSRNDEQMDGLMDNVSLLDKKKGNKKRKKVTTSSSDQNHRGKRK